MPLTLVPEFRISQRLYALNPASFVVTADPSQVQQGTQFTLYSMKAQAIWFKKSKGKVAVHIGRVWDYRAQDHVPTFDEFITQYSTSCYGGSVLALWDGSRFWSNDVRERAEQDALIERLNAFLSDYPRLPQGWLGWYKMEG